MLCEQTLLDLDLLLFELFRVFDNVFRADKYSHLGIWNGQPLEVETVLASSQGPEDPSPLVVELLVKPETIYLPVVLATGVGILGQLVVLPNKVYHVKVLLNVLEVNCLLLIFTSRRLSNNLSSQSVLLFLV